ncbi:MAG: DUF1080 domain-containing protein [Planctomycetota bacterium]
MRSCRTLLVVPCLLVASAAFADDSWQVLFDGKDLAGWRGTRDDGSFTVVDGVIRANAVDRQMNHLYYVGDAEEGFVPFKNFELELWARGEPDSNSGVFFHTDTSFRNSRLMLKNGYEIQLNSTKKEKRKTGSLYRVVDLAESVVDESEWFSVNVRVVDEHISVKINGEQVIDYSEPPNPQRVKNHQGKLLMAAGGAIAIQAHDPDSVFYFRDIRIKRLP